MAKYAVTTESPLLRVRNAENRNQRRLSKRVARVKNYLNTVIGYVEVYRPNGTLELYRAESLTEYTVKRDAQRAAKRVGGRFLNLTTR